MVLMAIACLGLGVAAVASVVSGGYRPERYGGGFDPVRAAALLSFGAMTAGFALAATIALRSFWSERRVFEITGVAFLSGLTVLAVAGFLFFATVPESSPPLVTRSLIQVLAYVGLGLVAAGMVPGALEGAASAVKRRDPNLLIVLIALALIVVIRLVWPD
jgi:xanthine/uracil permease